MKEMYEVRYENHYGTVRYDSDHEKEISRTIEETIVYEGDLKSCLDYLKLQMVDAILKFIDPEVTVSVSKYICERAITVEINVSESDDNEFRVYESSYFVYC